MRVVIKYSVEVEGLPVYSETYDVAKLEEDLAADANRTLALWCRRLRCAIACRARPGFSAALTRCLVDGHCGDYGSRELRALDDAGIAHTEAPDK